MKSKKARKAAQAPSVPRYVRTGYDEAARAYARLLLDPCNAPLTHPVGAPAGGILVRCQSIVPFGIPSCTSGSLLWVPGAIGSNNIELITTNQVAAGDPAIFAANTGAPGKTYLTSQASDYRCVAACLQVMYDGAESARAGRVSYGQVLGGFLGLSSVTSAAGVSASLEFTERMPQHLIEVKWRPNEYDLMLMDPGTSTPAVEKDRRSGIAISLVNMPAGLVIPIKLTAIYEYNPLPGLGVSPALRSTSLSSVSFQQVIQFIDRMAGNPWVQSAGLSLVKNLPTVWNYAAANTGFGQRLLR